MGQLCRYVTARMLAMSPAEKAKMGLAPGGKAGKGGKRRGVLRSVAAAPGNLVLGALGLAGAVAGSVLAGLALPGVRLVNMDHTGCHQLGCFDCKMT
jgi:hypothetical protein